MSNALRSRMMCSPFPLFTDPPESNTGCTGVHRRNVDWFLPTISGMSLELLFTGSAPFLLSTFKDSFKTEFLSADGSYHHLINAESESADPIDPILTGKMPFSLQVGGPVMCCHVSRVVVLRATALVCGTLEGEGCGISHLSNF